MHTFNLQALTKMIRQSVAIQYIGLLRIRGVKLNREHRHQPQVLTSLLRFTTKDHFALSGQTFPVFNIFSRKVCEASEYFGYMEHK